MGLYIFGAGGFGREVLCLARDVDAVSMGDSAPAFVVDDAYYSAPDIMGARVIRRSEWTGGEAVIAIGDPAARSRLAEGLSETFASLVHPSAILMQADLGEGAIVTAGCILTCNIRIGRHAHLNLGSSVGHDCRIGDFFTTAPGARVSGSCQIGHRVYLGTNASVREGITICDDVTIGMNAAVVRDITEPGVYAGVPARRIR